ncbi:MAG TPA: 2-dehydro-3-deoxygalactonokinase [Caulobacteraceae bacterium]|nr:2-dehydro-3-deoxygalactonokinase [Caulobacteraceae bacterium]
MADPAFLACDWGTTNLRAWLVGRDGEVLAEKEFALGVARLGPGEAQARFTDEVRPALDAQGLPAILCGMIGSNLGWKAVDYIPCPAGLDDVRGALATVAEGVRIVPGVRGKGIAGAPDVMRGEETQVFGWLLRDEARLRGRHVICHPGTHAKWILVEDGRLVRFITAMTGELFGVLGKHGVLKSDAPADDEAAFDAGLAAAGDGGALAARLFTARSRVVAGGEAAESTPSYLSGLLIGAEVASVPPLLCDAAGYPVVLLGDPDLCRWYERALTARGVETSTHDGEAAALAALTALQMETGT